MGCCVTKDVGALKNKKFKQDNNSLKLFQNLIGSNNFKSRLLFFRDLINTEQSNYKNKNYNSSIEFIQPQIKELHAIWIISMLKKLRSKIDTIFLLSRLIEIMELLDPLDENSIIRNHIYESGAAEILSNIIKYHKNSPEIVLICILLLTHLSFNDGISEKFIPLVSLLI